MTKNILIDAVHPEETRVVILDHKNVIDFDFASSAKKQIKGNIYLAKITRVEPSLQAAFVEYGGGKQGFLPFAEIHADYYQIPASDRIRLMEEAAREAEAESGENNQTNSDNSSSDGANFDNAREENNHNNSENNSENSFSTNQEAQNQQTYLPNIQQAEIALSVDHSYDNLANYNQDNIIKSANELPKESLENVNAEANAANNDTSKSSNISEINEIAGINETREYLDNSPVSDNSEKSENTENSEAVETISNEEDEIRVERKKRSFFKRYKIQDVIRRGQIVLVQVIKEERGNKGASLTTYLSLAGRYCVLMPNSPKDGGISRKIASPEDRKRLKLISEELRLAEGMSVIIRTAGMDRPRAEIKRDFDYLVKLWNHIREITLQSTAPAIIYEESDIIKRSIRDSYKNDVEEVIVQGETGFEAARDFMQMILPSHTSKVKLYKESTPLFYAYDVEDQLMSMHDPIVKLRSGGYIVINPTEALISIDVNSGRATGERNIEETAFKTNMEAAAEVARQLRLRDLAGLIVIDFIDMLESRNRRAVEKSLKDVLKADRAKIQLGRISPFGLLEMSRQRLRPSISETSMVKCSHCEGRGYIRSGESMSIQIIRALEKEASSGNWSSLRLVASQAVALYLLNNKRDALKELEINHNISVQVVIDVNLTASDFNLEKVRRPAHDRGGNRYNERKRNTDNNYRNNNYSNTDNNSNAGFDTEIENNKTSNVSAENITATDNSETTSDIENNSQRPRNKRGRRGGRNRNNNYRKSADYSQTENENQLDKTENYNSSSENNRSENNSSENNSDNIVDFPASEGENSAATHHNNQRNYNNRKPRAGRDGRGRNRWRNRSEGEYNNANESVQPSAQPESLPSFTQRPAISEPKPVVIPHNQNVINIHGETPRDPSMPSKKGWWQRMISLED